MYILQETIYVCLTVFNKRFNGLFFLPKTGNWFKTLPTAFISWSKKMQTSAFFPERSNIMGPNDLGKCIGPVNLRQVLWLNIIAFPKNLMQQFVDPVSLKSVASWVWKGNNRNIYWKNVNIFSLRLYNSEIVKL